MPAMNLQLTNPRQVAEAGQRIYQDRYQQEYERLHPREFVAIDVKTESPHIGETASDALQAALAAAPEGVFHLIKVGSPGAFKMSYSPSSASGVDWNFR